MAPVATRPAKRSWDALTVELADWILAYLASMGFASPTPTQIAVLELFRTNKDVVVEAITGSGKTLAFLIPVVERLLRREEPAKRHNIQALIIAPTRELASQIADVLTGLVRFHPPSCALLSLATSDEKRPDTSQPVLVPQLVVGGTRKPAEDLSRFLKLSPNVVVGTPGRIAELLSSPHVKAPASTFEVLVMDEADRLLDMGFSQELSRILGYLPKQRRTGLFSASISDAVQEIIKVGLLYPHKVTVRVKSKDGEEIKESKTPMSLQMSYLVRPTSQKLPALCRLLETAQPKPLRSIVFFATCLQVKLFSRLLPAILPPGFTVIGLHGKLEAHVRTQNLANFIKASSPTVLLTTDVAARGLDVPQVDLVVQVDPPQDPKVFIHRAGRAGRAGRPGKAVVLLLPGREEGFTELLRVRQTPITLLEHPRIDVTDDDAARTTATFRALARQDRDIFMLQQRAFVSWMRSYLEHQARSVFRAEDLRDRWGDLAAGWGLLELPRMPELKGQDVDRSLGLGIDTSEIPLRDKEREKKRRAEMAAWRAAKEQREKDIQDGGGGDAAGAGVKRQRNDAWSAKHEHEDFKVARRDKKRRKREAERVAKMTDQEREEQRSLDNLIGQVRKRNEEALVTALAREGTEAGKASISDEGEFEGFDD